MELIKSDGSKWKYEKQSLTKSISMTTTMILKQLYQSINILTCRNIQIALQKLLCIKMTYQKTCKNPINLKRNSFKDLNNNQILVVTHSWVY